MDAELEFEAKLPFSSNASDLLWLRDNRYSVPDDALVSEIAVHNGSDEIISNIVVELVLADAPKPKGNPFIWEIDFVGPKEVCYATFVVRLEAEKERYVHISMRVDFDDSVGNRWRRFDVRPRPGDHPNFGVLMCAAPCIGVARCVRKD